MDIQFNSINERVKYKYRKHLKCVSQKDAKTILCAMKHIRDFEKFTNFGGFEKFNHDIAGKYVDHLLDRNLSLSTVTGNIRDVKEFLKWLERQKGYRSKIDYNHTLRADINKKSYTFGQILQTIRLMPESDDKAKRDKAIISLQALCTLRVSELRTVKMKNFIEEEGRFFIYVCPKSMSVKFAKTRYVDFIPLADDIVENVVKWRDFLRSLGFKDSDPLFPKVDSRFGSTNLLEKKIRKEEIKSNVTIRNIFKNAFEQAGFDYMRPHSFRQTLAKYAETQTPSFLNAVRQNLGHSSIDTTLSSYGQLSIADQRKIISSGNIV